MLYSNYNNYHVSPIEYYKPYIKKAVVNLDLSVRLHHLIGFIIDIFWTQMIDVANEFDVLAYIFYTSSVFFLALEDHILALINKEDASISKFNKSNAKLTFSGLLNPLPIKFVLPSTMLKNSEKQWLDLLTYNARKYKETKGIIVNSFVELKYDIMKSLLEKKFPHVYPVGPVFNLDGKVRDSGMIKVHKSINIMAWLDDQPMSSVVFLCFGSMGTLSVDQVKKITHGLE